MALSAFKFHRFIRSLSQDQIAKATGLNQTQVSRLERGLYSKSAKDREARRLIAEFLGASESILFPGAGEDK